MEERVVSSAGGPQPQVARPNPTNQQPAPPPGQSPLSTYVVQLPKDRIYRVPPPENALIVENYRKAAGGPPTKKKTKKRPYLKYLIWIAVAFVMMGIMIGVGLAILYHSFTPKSPAFSVSKLHVKRPSSSSDQPPKYNVTLKVRNRNQDMGVKFGSVVEGAELIFWTKKIGLGQFPSLYQHSKDLNQVHVTLDGPQDRPLPPRIQKSMNDNKVKHQISLVLKFNSPLLMNVWIFKLWSRNLDVTCKFRVSTLGSGTKVLSQHCRPRLS